MSTKIHPTAVVESGAKIGDGVEIGAYAYVGPNVQIGDDCSIAHHAIIEGHTTLGKGCSVYPQAVLGTQPQDLKYHGEVTHLEIGEGNTFREMVTVHPGTENGGGITRIGDGNFFLIGVHIAHDCTVGNKCILANYVQLAGHVHVADNVNMGGQSAVHHFVSVGRHAFIGAMTRIPSDVPPFLVIVAARGSRSEIRMVNGVGLQRSGFKAEDIQALKDAYMRLFSRRARMSSVAIRDRVQNILDEGDINPHVEELCRFLMRSFAHGRHGRYLEALRRDPVHRNTWKYGSKHQLDVKVVGSGSVQRRHATKPEAGDGAAPEVIELTAVADPGWRFEGWNGSATGASNPLEVRLDSDKTAIATFTSERA